MASLDRYSRPHLIVLTGGEALLRPQLVCATTARTHGIRSGLVLATGLFYAGRSPRNRAIDRALSAASELWYPP